MNEIIKTQRRTLSYWFIDGIPDMVGGVALAFVGAFLYLGAITGKELFSNIALFSMILLFPLTAKLVQWLKSRITYPRTGFVKYPEPSGKRRGAAAMIAVVVAAGLVIVASITKDTLLDSDISGVILASIGIAIAVAFVVRAIKMGMPRFYVEAFVTAGISVWVLVAKVSFVLGIGVLWIGLGIVSTITGTIALVEYLHKHSNIAGEA